MSRQDYFAFARFLAQVLDRSIHVPGTDIRIGLDPIVGLIPGFGDAVASLAGSMILFLAAQLHVPKIVLVRMSVNIAINGAIGSIPLLGDLFSVWFQSNVKNLDLLERHVEDERTSTVADWVFVIGLLFLIGAVFVGMLLTIAWALAAVWQWVG
jgi:hypothetical protein